ENTSQPSLIEIKTVIGYGSPNKSASSASHGAPLGEEEVALTKEYYGWNFEEAFHVPEEVYADFQEKVVQKGANLEEKWNELFTQYKEAHPELAQELELAINDELPTNWEQSLPTYKTGEDTLATRVASSDMINAISKTVPRFFGGSADLASSNNT